MIYRAYIHSGLTETDLQGQKTFCYLLTAEVAMDLNYIPTQICGGNNMQN